MVAGKTLLVLLVIMGIIGAGAFVFMGGQAGGKLRLVFWHTYEFGSAEEEAINFLVAEYERLHPDIDIDVQFQIIAEAPKKFKTFAGAGQAPDVFRLQNDRLGEIAELGFLEPMTNYVDTALLENYLPMSIEAMSWNGVLYGLPASYDFLALMYDNDLVPEPPENTDELITLAASLKTSTRDGFVTSVRSSYWFLPWLYGFGGTIFDEEGNLKLNSAEAVRAAQWYTNLVKNGVMPDIATTGDMDSRFTKRKAAMIVQGPWFISTARGEGINLGVARLPKVAETGKWPAPLLGVKGYIISSGSKHKENAFEFVKFLTSNYAGQTFAEVAKTFPAMKAVHELVENDEDPVVRAFLDQAEVGVPMPSDPRMDAVWKSLDDALEEILGGKDAQEALNDAQSEILR